MKKPIKNSIERFQEDETNVRTVIVGGEFIPTNQQCPGEEDMWDSVRDIYIWNCE